LPARGILARRSTPPGPWATSTRSWTPALRELACPNFLIKIVPYVNGGQRFYELVRDRRQDVRLTGAWNGPAALQLFAHAMGNVTKLPVLNVRSGTNFVADVTLGAGDVVHDYLA
jgi:acetoacetate decarboxylase